MELSIAEQLTYSTVRIEAFDSAGNGSTGTGFIFDLIEDDPQKVRPIIITNKHVISGCVNFKITLTKGKDDVPNDCDHYPVVFNINELMWVMHPEADVDLCAIPLVPFLQLAKQEGHEIFFRSIGFSCLPTAEMMDDFDAIEEITMIGYPIGLWDFVNNKPIHRKGITATHFVKDYRGKKEFLIDCACFPGSSGSPVFILQDGAYKTKTGRLSSGLRLFLLGVLYAGHEFNAAGNIQVVDIPTVQKAIVSSSIPSNLGIVIKSDKIRDFKTLF